MVLSTLELELFRCGRVVPMEGGGVEEVVDEYGCFGGGRVVEIEDESCIDTERRQARQRLAGAVSRARLSRRGDRWAERRAGATGDARNWILK